MKRIISVFLLFLFAGAFMALQAQSQYYFRVGDTIRGRDSIYFYQWWSEDWLSNPNHRLYYDRHLRDNDEFFAEYDCVHTIGRYVRYNYTDQPLNIVGLAGCVYVSRAHGGWARMDEEVEPFHEEYLLLYDAQTDAFPLVAQVPFTRVEPVRYMEVPLRGYLGHYSNAACCYGPYGWGNNDWNIVVRVHEYYFDKPVTVHDSFYVGMTTNDAALYYPPEYQTDTNFTAAYAWTVCMFQGNYGCPDDSCFSMPPQLYKVKDYHWDSLGQIIDTSWRWKEIPSFILIFPIIEIDSSFYDGPPQYVCPSVENFRVGNEGDGSVVLLWHNHNDHLRWEVSYGPQGIAPEDGTQLIASIPAIMVQGLDSCTHYTAYIRAVCMHDSLHYSEWSEPLDICLCDTGGTAAIEVPLLERLTYLMPNPAAEQVEVLSSYGMTRVEAYSLQGTKMADLRVRGLGATLDVSDWPEGMYIVVVHTPAGNVTKKLVVK